MARIDDLLESYKRRVALTPQRHLPLSQRVWFVVYPPDEERRILNRITDFEIATRDHRLGWQHLDLSGSFADWMDTFDPDEREMCLRDPKIVEEYASPGFAEFLSHRLRNMMDAVPADEAISTVFAVSGLMDAYDFVHVSEILEPLDTHLPGIVVVFFPGEREGNTYRFLGARTGWNYLAIPILPEG